MLKGTHLILLFSMALFVYCLYHYIPFLLMHLLLNHSPPTHHTHPHLSIVFWSVLKSVYHRKICSLYWSWLGLTHKKEVVRLLLQLFYFLKRILVLFIFDKCIIWFVDYRKGWLVDFNQLIFGSLEESEVAVFLVFKVNFLCIF